jgi:hypothetical protein
MDLRIGIDAKTSLAQVTNTEAFVSNSSRQKSAELSGVAGELRCHSLHRSKISKDL